MFIKTERNALINSDYIRVIFIDNTVKPVALKAELDNGDHYVLTTCADPEVFKISMDEILAELDKEKSQ